HVGDQFVERDDAAVGIAHETEAFERVGARAVLGADGAGEPALVNAAAVLAEGEVVVLVQSDATAWRAERTRDPRRRQTEDAACGVHSPLDRRLTGLDVLVWSCVRHLSTPSWTPVLPASLLLWPVH